MTEILIGGKALPFSACVLWITILQRQQIEGVSFARAPE